MITSEIIYRSANGLVDFTINDQASLRSNWSSSPYFYICVDATDGLYGSDIEAETHTIPHAIGERSGDSLRRGKGFSLSGYIEAPHINFLQDGAAYLQEMFWDTSLRKLIWKHKTTGTDIYLTTRVVNDIDIRGSYSSFNPRWQWSVGLRADDPRFRKLSDNSLFFAWQT